MPTSAKSRKQNKLKLKPTFWAILRISTPFRVAGPSMTWYRYEIAGEYCDLGGAFGGFMYERKGMWCVHELVSGGLMCRRAKRDKALAAAQAAISITPDFHKQIEVLGPSKYREEFEGTPESLERILDRLVKEDK